MVTILVHAVRSHFAKLLRFLSSAAASGDAVDTFSLPERDQRINAISTPPPEEHVDLPCIWGIEFYTPSYIDELESGLQRLGWDTNAIITEPHGRDPIGWLRNLRRHRSNSAMLPLDILTTDESPEFLLSHRVPKLPQNVKYAQAHISAITPSLIAMTVCFTVHEETSGAIQSILREQRESHAIPLARGSSIQDPYSQKSAELEELREELRCDIADWFVEFLPGVLSSGNQRVPTWELITATVGHPTVPGQSERPPIWSYLRLIGFTLGLESWSYGDQPIFYVSTDRTRYHALAIGNKLALEGAMDGNGDSKRDGIVFSINEILMEVLPLWALVPLVDLYTGDIVGATVPESGQTEKALSTIRKSFLRRVDIPVVASELIDSSREGKGDWSYADAFTLVQRASHGEVVKLGESLRLLIGDQAVWLREADRAARDNLIQYGTLLASQESIRLQRRTKHLTYAVVVLTILTVLVPFIAGQCL